MKEIFLGFVVVVLVVVVMVVDVCVCVWQVLEKTACHFCLYRK